MGPSKTQGAEGLCIFRTSTSTSRIPPPECLRVQIQNEQCADTAEEEGESDNDEEMCSEQEGDVCGDGGEQHEQDEQYRCQRLDLDGNKCEAVFSSKHALAVHVASSKAEGHGQGIWNTLAITNQCPKCKVCFSGRRTAVQHIKSSIQRGYCTGRGSMVVYEPEPIQDMACGFCGERFLNREGLYEHMCMHVPGWN